MTVFKAIHTYEDGMGPVRTVFTILFVLALGVGGWFVYRFFAQPVTPVSIPINAPATHVKPLTTTYTDPAGVYRLTYPTNWQVNAQTSIDESIPLPIIDNKVLNFIPPGPSDSGFGIAGLFNVIAFQATDATVLSDAQHGNQHPGVQSLTINGYPALYQQNISTLGLTFTDDEYTVYHNGVTVYFTFREKQGPAQDVPSFDMSSEVPDFTSIVKSITFLH